MSDLPAEISLADQARAAGRHPPSYLQHDSIRAMQAHCLDVIAHLPGDTRSHGITQAKAKLQELTFWLNYHMTTQKPAE